MVVLSILLLPFNFAFVVDGDVEQKFLIAEFIICCIFLSDICVTLNTAVLHQNEGIFHTTYTAIAFDYCKGWFVVDLASSIPIDFILLYAAPGFDASSFRLIRLVRFIRITKIIKFLRNYELSRSQNAALGVVCILGLCHTFGCFWWYLGTTNTTPFTDEGYAGTWIEAAYLADLLPVDAGMLDQYVISVYYATVTLLTIGYGDIHPVNDSERGAHLTPLTLHYCSVTVYYTHLFISSIDYMLFI